MEDKLVTQAKELVAQLGGENTLLLLKVMQTFGELRNLLLNYCEYTQALSDVATEALNRRLILNNAYRVNGYFASVLYMVDEAEKVCRMDFDCEGNGVFSFRFAVGESEESDFFQLVIEQGISLEFVRLMLESLCSVHYNLYDQLTAVSKGYGRLIVEPKEPN